MGPNTVACVLKEKGEWDLDTQTEKKQMEGEHQMAMETEIRVSSYKPRNASSHQQLGRA